MSQHDPIPSMVSPRLSTLGNPQTSNLDSSYYKYIGNRGVHVYEDINRQRAMEQSGWAQAGRALWNIVPEAVGQIVGMAGSLGALLTEWGDDRDYQNDITRAGEWIRTALHADVYQKDSDSIFDFGDLASYLNLGSNIAGSAAGFAIGGAGIAKLAMGGVNLMKGVTASRALLSGARHGAQMATASTLAYAEGALAGAQVYNKTFENNYRNMRMQGIKHEEAEQKAKYIAAHSAATATQLNTILNTGLNMTALAPFFRAGDDAVIAAVRQQTKKFLTKPWNNGTKE
jgi:hypothetical protein